MKPSRRKTLTAGVQRAPAVRIRIGQLKCSGDGTGMAEALRTELEDRLSSAIGQTPAAAHSKLDGVPARAADTITARVNAVLKKRGRT